MCVFSVVRSFVVYWNATFQSVINVIELTDEPTSQVEIQEYAQAMKKIMLTFFPETTKLWFDDIRK